MFSSNESDNEGAISCSGAYRRPLLVAVEGNIGSGKSTFLNYCSSRNNVEVVPEPVKKWRNFNGVNLLGRFYEDPKKWAMTFQLNINLTMVENYRSKSYMPIKLLERSLLSVRYCFVENMKASGDIEPAMAAVLGAWYDEIGKDYRTIPQAIVYIRTTPEVAHGRMLDRARGEEVTVSVEYLSQLHRRHEEWLTREHEAYIAGESEMPIYTIDADLPMEQVCAQYEGCLQSLNCLTIY